MTLGHMGIVDIYRASHSKTTEYVFFFSAHGTFSSMDHMLGHKTSLNIFKKIKIIASIFSDHNSMKMEINRKNKSGKTHEYTEIKQHATKQLLGSRINKRRDEKIETNENDNTS